MRSSHLIKYGNAFIFALLFGALAPLLLYQVHGVHAAPLIQYNCTTNSGSSTGHCYGTQYWGGANGADTRITLHQTGAYYGGFVTNELWLVTSNSAYWVEDGVYAYTLSRGFSAAEFFWADSRPNGGGFAFHDGPTLTNADYGQPNALTRITRSGTSNMISGRQTTWAAVPPHSSSLGRPAIRPTLPVGTSPRFTTDDVRAYLRTHPFLSGPPVKGATPTIVAIQFMMSKQASALMHGASTGLPDTAIVCYVKFHGPFTQIYAPVPPGAKPLPPSQFGVEIFDGQTGNLLMWWTP